MRSVMNQDQFTPFGLWVRQFLRKSNDGLSVTNLDYVLEDFKRKRIMLLEEKSSGGKLNYAQKLTFAVLDKCLREVSQRFGYTYWGFFVLQFPAGTDMPGPGMTLNGQTITGEQLRDHLNMDKRFCDGHTLDGTN